MSKRMIFIVGFLIVGSLLFTGGIIHGIKTLNNTSKSNTKSLSVSNNDQILEHIQGQGGSTQKLPVISSSPVSTPDTKSSDNTTDLTPDQTDTGAGYVCDESLYINPTEDPEFKEEWSSEVDALYYITCPIDIFYENLNKSKSFTTSVDNTGNFERFMRKYLDNMQTTLSNKDHKNYRYDLIKAEHGSFPEDWAFTDDGTCDLYTLRWVDEK